MKVNQRYIAKRLGISEGYLSRILNMKRKPTWNLAKKMGNVYVLPPADLMDMEYSTTQIIAERTNLLTALIRKLEIPPETLLDAIENKTPLPKDLCIQIAMTTGCDLKLWDNQPADKAIEEMGNYPIENYRL